VLAGQKKTYMPPVHLWKIRSTLYRFEHIENVHICDEHMGEDCKDFFAYEKYYIAGISCRFSIQHNEYIQVAKIAKESKTYVVSGGIHAAVTEKLDNVDIVTQMRGEEFFQKILGGNLSFNINDYPYPKFSEQEIRQYWDKNRPHDLQSKTDKWMSVLTSIGCDRRCNFCGINNFSGHWQPYSLTYMDKYFQYLAEKGIQELFIEDDNFILDKDRFIKLRNLIKRFNFHWSCPNGIYARNLLDEKVLKAFAGSGCWRVSLAFETGSKKSAKLMGLGNKWINFISAEYLVNRLKKMGILTCGFFIIGYPGETEEDIRKTFDYANRLDLDQRNIYVATPYPGTQLYKDCVENNYVNVSDDFYRQLLYKNAIINTPWLLAERVMELKKEDRDKALKRGKLCQD
jgi:radical SAM superfamily enzyme YgiQ (UPF0313 family)